MVSAYQSAEKRSQLIRAATTLLHSQGFERTTLADVATRARVPLGNLYYYFRTKDALAGAVIEAHLEGIQARFASWEDSHRAPGARLHRLVLAPLDEPDGVIQFGCPYGSLCQELGKFGARAPLAKAAARLLSAYVDWAEKQFRAHGCGRESAGLASDLVASLQGTMLLAHTLRSQARFSAQIRRIDRWLDGALTKTRKPNR